MFSQGLVAMDNDDVTVVFIMNGVKCIDGGADHSMANFIKAKKRQLAREAGHYDDDRDGRITAKIPRR